MMICVRKERWDEFIDYSSGNVAGDTWLDLYGCAWLDLSGYIWDDITGYMWRDFDGYTWDTLPQDCNLDITDSLLLSDSISKVLAQVFNDPLFLNDSVSKTLSKTIGDLVSLSFFDPLFLNDSVSMILSKVLCDPPLLLSDSISKVLFKTLSDSLLIDDSVIKIIVQAINSPLFLSDSISKILSKVLTDILSLDDSVDLIKIIFSFLDYLINPEYIITDCRIYGGSEMHFYPDQAIAVKFKLRQFVDDVLFTADSFNVEVFDPKEVKRVVYNSAYMTSPSTGSYKYIFHLPEDVVEGDWHVKVTATKGTWSTVLNIHFEVRKK